MTVSEMIINTHYDGLNPVQLGYEKCSPHHSYGPAVRTHWLLHYVVYGFGKFERDGVTWSVNPGDIFVIPPYEETYYEADRQKPWRYILIGFHAKESLTSVFDQPVIRCHGVGNIFEDMLRCDKMENGRSALLSS